MADDAKPRKKSVALSPTARLDLIRDRLKPMGFAQLAAKYGVTETTARTIFYQWARENEERGISGLSKRDPIEIVWESVARLESWITQLADIAYDPDAENSHRTAAIRAQMDAQAKLTDLLQATGILPKHLGRLRIEADVRYVAQTIIQVLQEEQVPESVQERIIGAIRGASSN